jgi:hypothetical protein
MLYQTLCMIIIKVRVAWVYFFMWGFITEIFSRNILRIPSRIEHSNKCEIPLSDMVKPSSALEIPLMKGACAVICRMLSSERSFWFQCYKYLFSLSKTARSKVFFPASLVVQSNILSFARERRTLLYTLTGQGKPTYTFSAERQWLSAFRSPTPGPQPAGSTQAAESGTLWEVYTLIYPDPVAVSKKKVL